ncbi:tRNA (N6-isopentenyl adenosine(37)-C2)-methylthiotransferase MiaB [Desulforhopalus sp. IMCC35007]|uniref:tRNA (N6-isopentenyl adenosine(37)-C2)-methylthiotransferase MiaB n=1 Tax=Desulforhopalus sp. IMCC35007 TaxID=2569543 RepID=UPI0010AE6DD8|nr:tRNA (N6-isopentenyl adenosine(37)-C2)-methylthiotransferase MiaB [Desulforhopalus sp. IMCC35007]TKB11129.1 tRNA (N6-isopentenyl adenosine(37)-C2)-methylthiotransferase MiaB [Desulforhopalus sp. IMCC35007]
MENKQFFIKTFGCQMNERDSEIMAQSLSRYGYVEGMEVQEADLVILNTCSIRAKAEQKVMSLLGYLRKTKEKRPHMKICVAGCVAQQEGKTIIDRMPHVDLIVGTQNIYNIGELLLDAEAGKSRVVTQMEDSYVIPLFLPELPSSKADTKEDKTTFQFSRFVTIMQGCNNYCTYCVVPYTRGREVSRKVQDIVDEVTMLVQSGVKEITLLGQNVNSYGKTNEVEFGAPSFTFSDLLRRVAAVNGLKRLRFTTSNPKDLTDDLMSCFRDVKNLCPQFHLPVQAGSDTILKAMNRKYTVQQYLEQVKVLREYCPSISLSTDIIVGFPGETDADFEGTMDLLETVRYHGSFSFKYSDRPGTRSAGFENKVDEAVKSERLARFQARQDEISLERNAEFVGLEKEILVEQVSSDSVKGRTDTNHIVHVNEPLKVNVGDLLTVKINFAGQHSLKAELI